MKRLLLFSVLLICSTWHITAQHNQNQNFSLTGLWIFEKAEYMERASSQQNFQVKHTINNVENLYAHSNCYHELVKSISFFSSDVAEIEALFATFLGNYFLMPPSHNKQIIMYFGNHEDIGKDSPIPGMKFNAPGIKYLIEYIDNNTISISVEKICSERGIYIESAIKSIMKRQN